jgi:hypothetical protein
VDEACTPELAEDVLEEVVRDAGRQRDLLGGDRLTRGCELDRGANGVVGFRSGAHSRIMLLSWPSFR